MIKLSVIVLCYHGDRWIGPCVNSLENQSIDRELYEIILVDNGRTTPSLENYKTKNHINVLDFKNNLGFAGGNNKALVHSKAEIVILMNQDVVVHPNCLKEMLDAFLAYPEAGVISANMHMVRTDDILNLSPSISNMTGIFTVTRMGYASYRRVNYSGNLHPVTFVSGNALGFRKTILKDIGNYLFDSCLGSYAEDLDFSMRISSTPWKMFVCSKAVVYHFRDNSFSGSPLSMLKKFIHVSSNRLLVYFNNLSLYQFLLKLPLLLFGLPLKVGRIDGDTKFHFLRFIVGCAAEPLVLISFVAKIVNNRYQKGFE